MPVPPTSSTPRRIAVGSIAATYARYPNARGILPAMGYGEAQTRDLEATIRAMVDAGAVDAVVSGTPVDLTRVLTVDVPLDAGPVRAARAGAGAHRGRPAPGPRPLTRGPRHLTPATTW